MKVVFRADASVKMGSGHVMRCLTLAEALKENGADVLFISRAHNGNLNQLIIRKGFQVIELPKPTGADIGGASTNGDDYQIWLGVSEEQDAKETIEAIGGERVDWLVGDHYTLGTRWETALRAHSSKIMVIDDLADRDHDCDLLLDQNLVADMDCRYNNKLPVQCVRMLGPKYALLQPQYSELHERVPCRQGPIRRVFVYFGGADTHNITGKTIDAFFSLGRRDIWIDVVINKDHPYKESIRSQSKKSENIKIYEDLPSLATLMAQADLAVGAGGASSWERCCLGLPALVITIAENQKLVAEELDRRGVIRWIGHKNINVELGFTTVLRDILNSEVLRDWSDRCRAHVDGRGAKRITDLILNKNNEKK